MRTAASTVATLSGVGGSAARISCGTRREDSPTGAFLIGELQSGINIFFRVQLSGEQAISGRNEDKTITTMITWLIVTMAYAIFCVCW